MNDKILLIDVAGLCHRFFHSVQNLQAENIPTTISFKMMQSILEFGYKFKTNKFVFLFEGKNSLRKQLFPEYKFKRKEKTDAEKELYASLYEQIDRLREDLQALGFRNCYSQEGYEADDLIAVISKADCLNEIIIISSDEDLFQLIASNVSMFSSSGKNENGSRGKHHTYDSFVTEYNFMPENWWKIKALAGCSTDEVPGIAGVGEKKAIEFFNKSMNKSTATFKKIISKESKMIYDRNIPLVKLPFAGCNKIDILDNKFSKKMFMELCEKYQMYSFLEPEELIKWKWFFMGNFEGVIGLMKAKSRKLKMKRNVE